MKSKPVIEWLTKSSTMYDYYMGNNNIHLRGGRLYEIEAINTLQNFFNVKINPAFIKRENFLMYYFKSHKSLINGDVCLLDPYVVALGKFNKSKKNITIIHHVDEPQYVLSPFGRLFLHRLLNNLKKVDKVIVVSQYWKDYLNNIGIKNVEVIYNSFDVNKYKFSEIQRKRFLEKHFPNKRGSIIYLGQNSDGKGLKYVLNEIDEGNSELIITGKNKYQDSRVQTMYFSSEEFPLFLSICDIVILMSTMPEGWNRIAHEALLSGVPVIGSGSGGMRELLEKSGQVVINNISDLKDSIKFCYENKESLVQHGISYAKQFDLFYFSKSWRNVIESIL